MHQIGTWVNEIREDKGVTVEQLTQNIADLDRVKYYRFVNQGTGMSVEQIAQVLAYMDEEFTVLDEKSPIFQTGIYIYKHSAAEGLPAFNAGVVEITRLAGSVAQTAELTDLLRVWFQVDGWEDAVNRIYRKLKSSKVFTLYEVMAFSLIEAELSPVRFIKLYHVFVASLRKFYPLRGDVIWQYFVERLLTASVTRILAGYVKSVEDVWLMLDFFANYGARTQFFEFFVKRKFVRLLKEQLQLPKAERDEARLRDYVHEVANAQLNGISIWEESVFQTWGSQIHRLLKLDTISEPAVGNEQTAEIAQTLGGYLEQMRKAKGITIANVTSFGATGAQLRRSEADQQKIRYELFEAALGNARLVISDLYPILDVLSQESRPITNTKLVERRDEAEEEMQEFQQTHSLGALRSAQEMYVELATVSGKFDEDAPEKYRAIWQTLANQNRWGARERFLVANVIPLLKLSTNAEDTMRAFKGRLSPGYTSQNMSYENGVLSSLYLTMIVNNRDVVLADRIREAQKLKAIWTPFVASPAYQRYLDAYDDAQIKAYVLKELAAEKDINHFASIIGDILTPVHEQLFMANLANKTLIPAALDENDGWL